MIEKGMLRLAIHAFVRPNRGATFNRHPTPECVGTALAADMMRAHRVLYGVCVDGGVEPGTVLEVQAERVNECSGQRRQLECEVGCPCNPIVGTMLGYLANVDVGVFEQKEMCGVRKRGYQSLYVWDVGASVHGGSRCRLEPHHLCPGKAVACHPWCHRMPSHRGANGPWMGVMR